MQPMESASPERIAHRHGAGKPPGPQVSTPVLAIPDPRAVRHAAWWAHCYAPEASEWRDLLHDGIVRLLESQTSPLIATLQGQKELLRYGMIDSIRRQYGTKKKSKTRWQGLRGTLLSCQTIDNGAAHPPGSSRARFEDRTPGDLQSNWLRPPQGRQDAVPRSVRFLDVQRVLARLVARERYVLEAWADDASLQEIAGVLGVTQGRVSQILQRILPGTRGARRRAANQRPRQVAPVSEKTRAAGRQGAARARAGAARRRRDGVRLW